MIYFAEGYFFLANLKLVVDLYLKNIEMYLDKYSVESKNRSTYHKMITQFKKIIDL